MNLSETLTYYLASWIGVRYLQPDTSLGVFLGTRMALADVLLLPVVPIFAGLACLFLLFLLRVLLRREWIAAVLFVLITTAFGGLGFGSPLRLIWTALAWGAIYFILVRFGLLAMATSAIFSFLLRYFPITPELSAWYSGFGHAGVVLMLGFAAYAFHTSLGGRPMFQAKLLED